MGKASKWFRALLGLKSTDSNRSRAEKLSTKKKWGFVEEKRLKTQHAIVAGGEDDNEASKQAIAVSAATASVAEAAAAAVQLTSNRQNIYTGGSGCDVSDTAGISQSNAGYLRREKWAAVTIQSRFRAYLSRRALRALKALVKLQALVRGHLVRKQTAYALRRLQALVRAQVRARAGRVQLSESPRSGMKSSHFNYPGPSTPEKFEHAIQARSMKHDQLTMLKRESSKSRLSERMCEHGSCTVTLPVEDDRIVKLLEVDTGSPHVIPKRRTLFHSCHLSLNSDRNCQNYSTSKESAAHQSVPSPSSGKAQLSPLKFTRYEYENAFRTAGNSPAYCSASSRGGISKRDGSRSCLSGCSNHPNYMACTESSKAKMRSLSAPKQRPHQFERSGSTKRCSVHAYGDSRSTQFTNKAYPGSGRLDQLGMPVGGDVMGYNGGRWHVC